MNEPRRWHLVLIPALALLLGGACGAWWLTHERCRLSLAAHRGPARAVALSADGALLASGGEDGEVRLWDMPSGRARAPLPSRTPAVSALGFSPSGALAVGRADGSLALWDAGEREAFSVKAHKDGVSALRFSADGATLYSAGGDRLVKGWNHQGKEVIRLSGHTGKVWALALSPDGSVLASAGGGDNAVRLWRPPSRTPALVLRGHTRRVTALAFSRGGQVLLSADRDGQMKAWELATGREGDAPAGTPGRVIALAAPEGGDSVLAGSEELGLLRWPTPADQPRRWAHRRPVHALAVSKDGRTAATAGADGRVRVWDVGR